MPKVTPAELVERRAAKRQARNGRPPSYGRVKDSEARRQTSIRRRAALRRDADRLNSMTGDAALIIVQMNSARATVQASAHGDVMQSLARAPLVDVLYRCVARDRWATATIADVVKEYLKDTRAGSRG
jgi:hypothetical protein